MINSLCGGAFSGAFDCLSKMLDLASHNAFVTGEWYIPGHKLMGFLIEEPASMGAEPESSIGVVETEMGTGSGGKGSDENQRKLPKIGFGLASNFAERDPFCGIRDEEETILEDEKREIGEGILNRRR